MIEPVADALSVVLLLVKAPTPLVPKPLIVTSLLTELPFKSKVALLVPLEPTVTWFSLPTAGAKKALAWANLSVPELMMVPLS